MSGSQRLAVGRGQFLRDQAQRVRLDLDRAGVKHRLGNPAGTHWIVIGHLRADGEGVATGVRGVEPPNPLEHALGVRWGVGGQPAGDVAIDPDENIGAITLVILPNLLGKIVSNFSSTAAWSIRTPSTTRRNFCASDPWARMRSVYGR